MKSYTSYNHLPLSVVDCELLWCRLLPFLNQDYNLVFTRKNLITGMILWKSN